MMGSQLALHRAFWDRANSNRPLLGINIGFTIQHRFPRLAQTLPVGPVQPGDIRRDLFLQDCDWLHETHQGMGDYPFVAAPFVGVPWLEAIVGCPIQSSGASMWAEPCVKDWKNWQWQMPTPENPWMKKLLELTEALVKHAAGRYGVAPTLMRGPADILAAMRSATQFPLDLLDEPETMARAVRACAEVHEQIGRAQLALIPQSTEGYIAGDAALRTWAPDKIVWLQEDAMALLSPKLYRQFFLQADKQLAAAYPCVAYHLHGTGLWAIDDLVQVPDIDVIELNLEDALCDVEGTLNGWKKIQQHKPLVVWRMYKDDFTTWLHRILKELPPNGVAIQVSTNNVEEARKAKAAFEEAVGHTD